MMQKSRLRRITAWIAMMAVLFVMLLSFLYVSQHIDHDCTGEDCPICAEMMTCANNIRSIGALVVTIAVAFCLCLSVKKSMHYVTAVYSDCSLISQKVRMNN